MADKTRPLVLVRAEENTRINREVLSWLDDFPGLPVLSMMYETLPAKAVGMALSTIQGAYIVTPYIYGGYLAEYQFKIIYRIQPGNSVDSRLKADELLDRMGDWAADNPPTIPGIKVVKVEATSRSSLFAAYDGGDEDHQILMKLTYEVNV